MQLHAAAWNDIPWSYTQLHALKIQKFPWHSLLELIQITLYFLFSNVEFTFLVTGHFDKNVVAHSGHRIALVLLTYFLPI
mmetsp:Transcript_116474/g.206201  ORF Transcript_116474/g.206201 Transcript_116474/m.206201 type:complete len:80 (+) Transcript_116474:44-283(+)